ncbi:hypothetical protein K501DRAFT_147548, partial [Backusella circina FSU 941]
LFLLLLSSSVYAQVQSPSHNYNVTLPEPNTPYVAGQMLPISYTLPNDANLSKQLALSVYFTTKDTSLNFSETLITSNADLSQGFSFKRGQGDNVVYEHQLSYSIPNNTVAGDYQVVFLDAYTRFNTTIPIIVRPYADAAATTSSVNKARPSGSIFA